jgi:hypothetical protein
MEVRDLSLNTDSERVVCKAVPIVMLLQSTSSWPATVIEPVELVVKVPLPAQLIERLLFAVVLKTAEETVTAPALSIRTFPAVIAATNSEALIFTVAPEALAWTKPSNRTPPLVAVSVTVTVPGTKVGAMVNVVPTKASAVIESVREPLPTSAVKPRFVNVATPPTVRTVTAVTADPPTPTRKTCPVAVMVTSYSAAPFPAVTWMV